MCMFITWCLPATVGDCLCGLSMTLLFVVLRLCCRGREMYADQPNKAMFIRFLQALLAFVCELDVCTTLSGSDVNLDDHALLLHQCPQLPQILIRILAPAHTAAALHADNPISQA